MIFLFQKNFWSRQNTKKRVLMSKNKIIKNSNEYIYLNPKSSLNSVNIPIIWISIIPTHLIVELYTRSSRQIFFFPLFLQSLAHCLTSKLILSLRLSKCEWALEETLEILSALLYIIVVVRSAIYRCFREKRTLFCLSRWKNAGRRLKDIPFLKSVKSCNCDIEVNRSNGPVFAPLKKNYSKKNSGTQNEA